MKSKNEYEAHASVFQADIDHDMRLFEEQVDLLEAYVEGHPHTLIGKVVGMVVVQLYLNQIRRTLEEDEQS